MALLVIWTVLFRLRVTKVVKQWLLLVQNLIMGVYDVTGVKVWIKRVENQIMHQKAPQIWSVKYTKFDNFSKKHVSMVDLMSRHYFVPSLTVSKVFVKCSQNFFVQQYRC